MNSFNLEIKNKTELHTTTKSQTYPIFIKKEFLNDIENEHFAKVVKDSYICQGEYYQKKDDIDYLFSPLNNDKKQITKSNALKDIMFILSRINTKFIENKTENYITIDITDLFNLT